MTVALLPQGECQFVVSALLIFNEDEGFIITGKTVHSRAIVLSSFTRTRLVAAATMGRLDITTRLVIMDWSCLMSSTQVVICGLSSELTQSCDLVSFVIEVVVLVVVVVKEPGSTLTCVSGCVLVKSRDDCCEFNIAVI